MAANDLRTGLKVLMQEVCAPLGEYEANFPVQLAGERDISGKALVAWLTT